MASLEAIFPVNNVFPNNIEQSFASSRKEATKKDAGGLSNTEKSNDSEQTSAEKANNNAANNSEHTPSDKVEISKLAARDREVRAHEAAHKAAGGQLTGPAQFDYEQGPDNKRYAVSGEVSIDTSEVDGNPQATLQKANQIKAAALAPANPSSQDRIVAAQASVMAAEAQAALREAARTEREKPTENNDKIPGDTTTSSVENQAAGISNVEDRRFENVSPATSAQTTNARDFSANTEAAITQRPGALIDLFA